MTGRTFNDYFVLTAVITKSKLKKKLVVNAYAISSSSLFCFWHELGKPVRYLFCAKPS